MKQRHMDVGHAAENTLLKQGGRLSAETDVAATGLGGTAVGVGLGATHPTRAAITVRRPGTRGPGDTEHKEEKPEDDGEVCTLLPSHNKGGKDGSDEPAAVGGKGVGVNDEAHSKHGAKEHGQETLGVEGEQDTAERRVWCVPGSGVGDEG
jgi:hypothetical protein